MHTRKLYGGAWGVLAVILACLAGINRAAADSTLPPKALIRGVPFVAWSTAARAEYENKTEINPSWEAASRMIVGYWAPDGSPAGRADETLRALVADLGRQDAKEPSLEDLKAWVASGRPVLVVTTWTPYAHPIPSFVETGLVLGTFKGLDFGPEGSRSNALGRMISLEALQAVPDSIRRSITGEALHIAARILVGYDEDRRVFLLHDPTFGPAFELGYADFERMWRLSGKICAAPQPVGVAAPDSTTAAYPPLTVEQRAAKAFVFGYALSSTARLVEGEREFEAGSGLIGLGRGYRHLLLFELALNYGEQHRIDDAVEACRLAVEALPENAAGWLFLASVCKMSPSKQHDSLRKDAEKKAKKVRSDKGAIGRAAAILPSDFWISGLADERGWAAP